MVFRSFVLFYILFFTVQTATNAQQSSVKIGVPESSGEFVHSDEAAAGNWRGLIELKPGVEIPFNFTIEKSQSGLKLFFLNGEEKFEAGLARQIGDSILVALDPFDNELVLHVNKTGITGSIRKQDKTGNPLLIKAEKNKNYRFEESGISPAGDISGTYDIVFSSGNGKEEKAVGLFTQTGNRLKATFLRITGDSRYLEGIVEGNKFYLSSFIGSSPSYYKGSFNNEGRLTGEIVGARSSSSFSGTVNDDASLPNPYQLTYLKEGYRSFDFSFPDVNGKKVSLSDEKFRNKVVIITITGSWCPNCMDETSFLAPWYKANHQRGIEAVALHYERKTDSAFVRKALTRLRNKFDIQYDQLIAGTSDKQFVAESLPSLNAFLSFPTTIIVGKNGKVARIHTGFSGPATGKYYEQFVKEFNETIDSLVKEQDY
ncbi:MAG: TlpA disulfide reductase family protein [Chitinophagaceae bacterium]